MKVVFSDGPMCDYAALKRLVVVADEIGFMDRPGVIFGGGGDGSWGFVGMQSPVRNWDTSGLPVRIGVHRPPSGVRATEKLYAGCAAADLANIEFVRVFLHGFTTDLGFASLFVSPDGRYPGGKSGAEVREALLADRTLAFEKAAWRADPPAMFEVDTHEQRVDTLRTLLIDASTRVTSALAISADTGLVPVSESPHFARLLAIRSLDSRYIGWTPRSAPVLGLAVARAVVPDAALEKLELKDLFEYRRTAADAYAAWSAEIDKFAARMSELPFERSEEEIRKIITVEVAPRLIEYRREMGAARDRLWGDLVKRVVQWELPVLAFSFIADISLEKTLVGMATLAGLGLGDIVDSIAKRDEVARKNAMAYLVKLSPGEPDDR
jgi:hypothetical protein